jgi:low affinity Fe/Cu permease
MRRQSMPHEPVRAPIQSSTSNGSINEIFRSLAYKTADVVGSPFAFTAAAAVVIVWAITGPIFDFSDTWQLMINTGTTIVTFLIVFLIQYTQNRDTKVIQLKLDELIRSIKDARNGLVQLENLPDETIKKLQQEFDRLDIAEEEADQCVSSNVSERRR